MAGESTAPGVVLGPDGKPCKTCTAFRNWNPTKDASKAKAKTKVFPVAENREGCPVDGEQLGRATWSFLHTTAAYYPEKPSTSQRANMLNLLHALPVLYPCSMCATHLGANIKTHPPDVSSRNALSRWLCEQHNEVNERLGKDKFDCTTVDERWKDGPANGRCD